MSYLSIVLPIVGNASEYVKLRLPIEHLSLFPTGASWIYDPKRQDAFFASTSLKTCLGLSQLNVYAVI
jgi:hypothetical protein